MARSQLRTSSRVRRPAAGALALAAAVTLVTASAPAASAVNADHGARVVSAVPSASTPHVLDGSVQSMVQIGGKIVAVGTFTRVSRTFGNTADDLVRNRVFAFDATTGAIDPAFDPNLGGPANSVDTDGTHVYVAGSFGSVGGSTAHRRIVKLTAAGAVVPEFAAVPNSSVNEVVVRGSRVFVGGGFSVITVDGTGTARSRLAALDADSGAVLDDVDVPFTGLYDPAIGGVTNVKRFDMSPDGTKLVAVGNFSTVGGRPRSQLAVLDTPADGPASVSSWATTRYDADHNNCGSQFDSFTRDVDLSPDGRYFVVTTTGGFVGGLSVGTLCDTVTRWEVGGAGGNPTWTSYTGGDTTYGVAVTGSAVYVGGHQRWHNNPYQGDNAGPGAVAREGIAALDPVNGLPLRWNPGRSRGVGAQALYATAQGLWVGSDTTQFAGLTRGRIAFLPLAGGTTVPAVAPATLPGDLFLAQRPCAGGQVLHRVNAGGPAIAGPDLGPTWVVDDPYRNTGAVSDWGSAAPVDATVPPCTSAEVFRAERVDVAAAPEMSFALPVTAGRRVQVRLYFADRCACTAAVGSRVFDVRIDGALVLNDFDINRAAGHGRGTMRAFTVTSDGTVDVAFGHVVQNPLVSAIEVVDATAGGPAPTGRLLRRPVDGGGSPTGPATTAGTALDWSTLRGGFVVNGTLYYGLADNALYARTFDPTTGAVGAQRAVRLYDDPETGQRIPFPIARMTGSFYDPATHRLYYTVSGGDRRLFYRWFTPESEVLGAQSFVAGSSVDLAAVSGMTLADGRVLYGSSTDGALRTVSFTGGAVTGSPTVVSDDGSWRGRALLVRNG